MVSTLNNPTATPARTPEGIQDNTGTPCSSPPTRDSPAGVGTAPCPSGNPIVWCTNPPRSPPVPHTAATAAKPPATTAKVPAVRRECRECRECRRHNTMTTTAATGSAVHFIATATPTATPATTGLPLTAAANARITAPVTGRSTPLPATVSATSGDPTATSRRRCPGVRGVPSRTRAHTMHTSSATAHHSRGSVTIPSPHHARGMPKSAIIGEYGL